MGLCNANARPSGVGQNQPYVCDNVPANYPGDVYEQSNYYADLATYTNAQAATCRNVQGGFGNLLGSIQVAKDIYAISQAIKGSDGDGLIRFYGTTSAVSVSIHD